MAQQSCLCQQRVPADMLASLQRLNMSCKPGLCCGRPQFNHLSLLPRLHPFPQTARNIRFVGLSTALANAQDLADWLGITGPVSARPIGLQAVEAVQCIPRLAWRQGWHQNGRHLPNQLYITIS